MKQPYLVAITYLLLFCLVFYNCESNDVANDSKNILAKSDLFDEDIIDNLGDSFISDTLSFGASNLSFYKIPSKLNTTIEITGDKLKDYEKCSYLPLDKTQNYSVATIPTAILSLANIKLPFLNMLIKFLPFPILKYCTAFNKNNFGIGFDNLIFPCIPANPALCGIELRGISLSNEGKLTDSSNKSMVIYDGLRKQQIPSANNFALQLRIAMPSDKKVATFFESDSASKKGYLLQLHTDLDIYSQLNRDMNLYYYRTNGIRLGLFFNSKQVLKIIIPTGPSGAIRDSRTDSMATCFPSGIYLNNRLEMGKNSDFVFLSEALGPLIGLLQLELEASLDAGFYVDFRRSQINGFFTSADINLSLFGIFNVKAYFEFTLINSFELKRRIDSMRASSHCPAAEINSIAKHIFDKLGVNSNVPSAFYLMGYLSTKALIKFPLLPGILDIKGYLRGFLALPNPFKENNFFHMEFGIGASIWGFSIDLDWEVDDSLTKWTCDVDILLVNIIVHVEASSSWLQNAGSLLKLPKFVVRLDLRLGKLLKKALEAINKALKKIAQELKVVWSGITQAVSGLRNDVKKLTNNLCKSPPCLLSNMVSSFVAILASPLAAAGSLFNNVFGKKKTETQVIGTNEFKCNILEITTKKCICAFRKCSCSTIGKEQKIDTACMQKVEAILLEATNLNELANWKEDVVTVNAETNMGFQYILDQIDENKLDFFQEDDLEYADLIHNLRQPGNSSSSYSRFGYGFFYENFDPSNQTFIEEFEDSFTSLFPPLNDTGEEPDLSDVYQNTQDLRITNELELNTTRLSSSFKGKDGSRVNLKLPVDLDFNNADRIEANFDDLLERFSEEKGEFAKTLIGTNVGITEVLKDAFGMTPPVISIKSRKNLTVYCDDPHIDDVYDGSEVQIIDRLKHFLTKISLDDVYKKCESNIEYVDRAECEPDEEICDATKCVFERYVFDECKQKSNVLYETIRILPRSPFFVDFPDNTPVDCNENVNTDTASPNRFQLPSVNPGCRGALHNLFYVDSLYISQCEEKVYRKWRAEIYGCENDLFHERTQELYVKDKLAPFFSYFPPDKHVEFFEAYGAKEMDYPRAYDSCGHGPSVITYNDTLVKISWGKRMVERLWTVKDS